MTKSNEEIRIASALICKDFNTPDQLVTEEWDELFKRVEITISNLLNRDMQTLMNIFYRLDISEQKVKKLLATSKPEELSKDLTREVLQREIEKAKTRIKYRNRN